MRFTIFLAACVPTTGNIETDCNHDGTCNSPGLSCQQNLGGYFRCYPKPSPPDPSVRCHYQSECFCMTCADKCGDAGVKQCAYSDTSVWGAKPAVCECK